MKFTRIISFLATLLVSSITIKVLIPASTNEAIIEQLCKKTEKIDNNTYFLLCKLRKKQLKIINKVLEVIPECIKIDVKEPALFLHNPKVNDMYYKVGSTGLSCSPLLNEHEVDYMRIKNGVNKEELKTKYELAKANELFFGENELNYQAVVSYINVIQNSKELEIKDNIDIKHNIAFVAYLVDIRSQSADYQNLGQLYDKFIDCDDSAVTKKNKIQHPIYALLFYYEAHRLRTQGKLHAADKCIRSALKINKNDEIFKAEKLLIHKRILT
jgi:hypothetical protein